MLAAARAGLARLAATGCSTTTDHHYVFPRDGGDVLAAEIDAAREVGLRFHPTRGSMDLGRRHGGLPPDHIVEDIDEILAATEAAIDAHHDPAPGSMLQIGVAPCSPFSVTEELLTGAAELARRKGVRLHTHLAETSDEDDYCRERFGRSPTQYLADLGWLGPDVWLAHAVHLDDAGGRPGWPAAVPRSRTARRPTPGSAPASPGPVTCGPRASRSASAWTARRPTRPARCSTRSGTRCCSPAPAAARAS